jgi:hypothetical protein
LLDFDFSRHIAPHPCGVASFQSLGLPSLKSWISNQLVNSRAVSRERIEVYRKNNIPDFTDRDGPETYLATVLPPKHCGFLCKFDYCDKIAAGIRFADILNDYCHIDFSLKIKNDTHYKLFDPDRNAGPFTLNHLPAIAVGYKNRKAKMILNDKEDCIESIAGILGQASAWQRRLRCST